MDKQLCQNTQEKYSSLLYSESNKRPESIETIAPTYDPTPEFVDGRIILRDNFDSIFSKYPESLIFGQDSGAIGDVNQGLEGFKKNMEKCEWPMQVFVKLQ